MVTKLSQDKAKINQATRNLKELLRNEKNGVIQEYLEGLSATEASDYSLWRATLKINKGQEYKLLIRNQDRLWSYNR